VQEAAAVGAARVSHDDSVAWLEEAGSGELGLEVGEH